MRVLILPFLFFLLSCGYPDIDTVPSFNNIKLTDEELFDLCQLSSTDKSQIEKCVKEKKIINE